MGGHISSQCAPDGSGPQCISETIRQGPDLSDILDAISGGGQEHVSHNGGASSSKDTGKTESVLQCSPVPLCRANDALQGTEMSSTNRMPWCPRCGNRRKFQDGRSLHCHKCRSTWLDERQERIALHKKEFEEPAPPPATIPEPPGLPPKVQIALQAAFADVDMDSAVLARGEDEYVVAASSLALLTQAADMHVSAEAMGLGESGDFPYDASGDQHDHVVGPSPRTMHRLYHVSLDRRKDDSLGIEVTQDDNHTLSIERVTGGLVQMWNDMAPTTQEVRPRDRIISVNGIRGDAAKMLKECERRVMLELEIKRARVLVDVGPIRPCPDFSKLEDGHCASNGSRSSSPGDEAAGGAEAEDEEVKEEADDTADALNQLTGQASILAALADGHTVLIRASWLVDLARQGGVMPRRQGLPEAAIWSAPECLSPNTKHAQVEDADQLRKPDATPRKFSDTLDANVDKLFSFVEIVAVSYCWLTPNHPDPRGEQLARLASALEIFCLSVKREVVVFIDWCSLYQLPRPPEEQTAFMQSLCQVSVWYTHQRTWKWLLTSLPVGWEVPAYEMRGWPTFELALSHLSAAPDMLIDLGTPGWNHCKTWSNIRAACGDLRRRPPDLPEAFAQSLDAKVFACNVDRGFIERVYRRTFEEVIGLADVLDFSFLGWGDEEAIQMALVIARCASLKRLYLSWNHIGDAGAAALASVLPVCSFLRRLGLAGNPISEHGRQQLHQAWACAGKQEDHLEIW